MEVSFNQSHHSLGDIINYGTVDAQNFGGVSWTIIYLISIPCSAIVGLTYTYLLMGMAIVPPLIVFLILMYINYVYVKKGLKYQSEYLKVRGERIKKTDEIFNNIRFIKSNCLETFFSKKIEEVRHRELKWVEYLIYRTVYTIFNSWLSPAIMTSLMLITYVLLGNTLDLAKIFTSFVLMRTYQSNLVFLPNVFGGFIDFMVSSERMTKYLASKNRTEYKNSFVPNSTLDIDVQNANFKWPEKPAENTENSKQKQKHTNDKEEPLLKTDSDQVAKDVFKLDNITFQVKKGELIAVIGKSGAGKSSLLLSLLGELLLEENQETWIANNPNMAYLPQKPWIRNETLQQNIVFGENFDQDRYDRALKYSALDTDVDSLTNGSHTVIGDKGVNLSGGQKVRVALARALYFDKDVYLLDDPLSALDINVGSFIFEETICKLMKNKTRIIVTHNIASLRHFDRIVMVDKGQIIAQGTFEEMRQRDDFNELINILNSTGLFEMDEQAPNPHNDRSQTIIQESEDSSQETIDEKIPKKNIPEKNKETVNRMNMNEELKEVHEISTKIIGTYLSIGSISLFVLSVISQSGFSIFNVFNYFFLDSQAKLDPKAFEQSYFFKIILAISAAFTIFPTLRGLFILLFGLSVSKKLNNLIIFRMLHGSMQEFFHKNPIGKILNRLSGDLDTIDRSLPVVLSQLLNISFFCLVNLSLIVYESSPWIAIFVIIYFVAIFMVQRSFSKTYVQVSRLDLTSKSPFYHLFTDAVNGVVDIRIYHKKKFIVDSMCKVIDFHVRCGYVLNALNKWFRMRVSLYATIFMVPALVLLVWLNPNFMNSVPILMTVMVQNMEYIISFMNICNETERNLLSFFRCYYYATIEPEKGYTNLPTQFELLKKGRSIGELEKVEEKFLNSQRDLIKTGTIRFENVSARYSPNLPLVLKGISFSIGDGEKIGIIGRTGAGKSSIVATIMRYFEEIEGCILIDDRDIYKIDVKCLRRAITYISQDSYFFEGTLRENLDPLRLKTDEEITAILKECDMWDKVNLGGGLNWQIQSNGANMSMGEKQIFCFVRAIINLSRIVIMDEATSSIDIKTESMLEKMKEKYFQSRTTLTIAHRLNTVYQSNRIMVLDAGRVKSFANIKQMSSEDRQYFNKYIWQMIV